MATCTEVPRYELVSSKKCIPEEEKYQNYLLETLNKKPTNTLISSCPYQPTPYPITKTFYGETCSNYPNAGYNSMVNYYNYSNAFTGFNRLPKQTTLEFGIPIEDTNIVNIEDKDFKKFKTEETFNLNTLKESGLPPPKKDFRTFFQEEGIQRPGKKKMKIFIYFIFLES